MKKILITVLLVFVLAGISSAGTITPANVSTSNVVLNCTSDSSCARGATNDEVIWTLSKMGGWENVRSDISRIFGGYFIMTYTLGTCDTAQATFYTSATDAEDDWAEYMPRDAIAKKPTEYQIIMPAASASWPEPIPFPELTRRVKMKVTLTDTEETCTDAIGAKMVPWTR